MNKNQSTMINQIKRDFLSAISTIKMQPAAPHWWIKKKKKKHRFAFKSSLQQLNFEKKKKIKTLGFKKLDEQSIWK